MTCLNEKDGPISIAAELFNKSHVVHTTYSTEYVKTLGTQTYKLLCIEKESYIILFSLLRNNA